jgi:hypothetical protein
MSFQPNYYNKTEVYNKTESDLINTSMKNYVDSQDTNFNTSNNNYINATNTSMYNYVNYNNISVTNAINNVANAGEPLWTGNVTIFNASCLALSNDLSLSISLKSCNMFAS